MMQLLNNLGSYFNITNLIYLISTIFETYLIITLLLLLFNIRYSKKQKIIYIIIVFMISETSSAIIPSPFNIIVNYIGMILSVKLIFKISLVKAFASLVVTVFIFVLFNTLIQNPYLTICDIPIDTFLDTPKYRIPYLTIFYLVSSVFIIFLKRYRTINLRLDLLDNLDKSTKSMLIINIFHGLLILIVQLIITDYYIDIVPLTINLLNFTFLISFLILSICSFTRMIKLVVTEKQLAYVEEYNKSLKILYDKVSGFKHDFENIMSYINGYISTNDMDGLKEYFKDVKKDYKIAENLSIINPHIINNPGLYSLLNNKFFKAKNLGISFDIEFLLNPNDLDINMYIFSRILGVLIDNAIEASEKCDYKIIKLSFIRDNINSRSVINIINTYNDKDLDISKIFKKGFSSKEQHSGIGLWQVNKYIKKSKNLELKPSKDDLYFKQELIIYDL